MYPSCFLSVLGTSVSDHCPLLMDLHMDMHMGRRFRFEAFWPHADGFMETVAMAWSSIPAAGNPFVVLDRKLRAMAKKLQGWSDGWIGNIKLQIAMAMELIYWLDHASNY